MIFFYFVEKQNFFFLKNDLIWVNHVKQYSVWNINRLPFSQFHHEIHSKINIKKNTTPKIKHPKNCKSNYLLETSILR